MRKDRVASDKLSEKVSRYGTVRRNISQRTLPSLVIFPENGKESCYRFSSPDEIDLTRIFRRTQLLEDIKGIVGA